MKAPFDLTSRAGLLLLFGLLGLAAATAVLGASDEPGPAPAAVNAEARIRELERRKDELWHTLEPGLRRRLSLVPADIENMIVDAFYADSRVSSLQSDLDWLVRQRVRIERTTARHPSDPSRARVFNEIRDIQKKKDEIWRTFEPRMRRRFTLVPADFDERVMEAFQADARAMTIQAELDKLQPTAKRSDTPPPPPIPTTAPPPPSSRDANGTANGGHRTDAETEGRPGPSGRAERP